MHDAIGRELKLDDIVLIPARITQLSATEEYCNVILKTLHGRRPDGAKEHIGAINTGVLFRANEGDENDFMTEAAKDDGPEVRQIKVRPMGDLKCLRVALADGFEMLAMGKDGAGDFVYTVVRW